MEIIDEGSTTNISTREELDRILSFELIKYILTKDPSVKSDYLNNVYNYSIYLIKHKFRRKELHDVSMGIAERVVLHTDYMLKRHDGRHIISSIGPVGHAYLLTQDKCIEYLTDVGLESNDVLKINHPVP